MIKLANIQGTIETKESELHHNIFRFADRRAYHIMTHRSDVTWIDVRATQEEIEQSIKESGYSKFLVCEDEIENVVGVAPKQRKPCTRLRSGAVATESDNHSGEAKCSTYVKY